MDFGLANIHSTLIVELFFLVFSELVFHFIGEGGHLTYPLSKFTYPPLFIIVIGFGQADDLTYIVYFSFKPALYIIFSRKSPKQLKI